MPAYAVDSNLFIRATRSSEWSRQLEAFFVAFTPWVHLHSVVVLEVLAGALKPELERKTQERFIAPFERRGRVVTPGHGAYKRAASALARLVRERKVQPDSIRRSFVNDCLIAASARDHGFTLVTENTRDFELISGILPIEFVAPWPAPGDAR